MFIAPPSAAKTHWVYDDPSGVADPPADRQAVRGPRRPVRRPVRLVHQDS